MRHRWLSLLVLAACHAAPLPLTPRTGPQAQDRGRAAPTYLALAPRDVTVRIGDTVRFTVARMIAGQPFPCVPLWDAQPSTVGTITAGELVGQAPGVVTVRASCAPLTATTTVTVQERP